MFEEREWENRYIDSFENRLILSLNAFESNLKVNSMKRFILIMAYNHFVSCIFSISYPNEGQSNAPEGDFKLQPLFLHLYISIALLWMSKMASDLTI